MRAAVYHGGGRVSLEEVPVPEIGPGELLVRMTACGVCGSDLMDWYQEPRAPVVLGHEPVGVVERAGEGAPFGPGRRVFVHHHVPCRSCERCRAGRETLCARFAATRIDPGGLAERIRVPAEHARLDVLELPDGMEDWVGTLVEPLACVLRGLARAGVGEGSRVAVVGAGAMGLLEAQAAIALGAAAVAMIEPRADRRDRAAGAGLAVLEGADPAALARRLDGPADVVVVCTHHHGAIADALPLAGPGGVVQLFAPTVPGELVGLDLGAAFFREVTLQSTYSAGPADTRAALGLLAAGRVDASLVITHRLPLDRVEEGFALARSGRAMKVVIEGPGGKGRGGAARR